MMAGKHRTVLAKLAPMFNAPTKNVAGRSAGTQFVGIRGGAARAL